jgi:hypothetical protein
MCFSASASFGAAAIIGTVGTLCLKRVYRPAQIMFASIPMVFAVQQIAEGFIWLSLSKPPFMNWQMQLVMFFLFFAQVLWTTWVPLSLYLLEAEADRRKWLGVISIAGAVCSALLGCRLLLSDVTLDIKDGHIVYDVGSSRTLVLVSGVLYLVTTVMPGWVSSIRGSGVMASLLALSLAVTTVFFNDNLVSVWCYFAALISVIVYWVLNGSFRETIQPAKG